MQDITYSSEDNFLGVSYAVPRITRLQHAFCQNEQPLQLRECPRQGQGLLTVSGSNFGSQGAVVLLGSKICQIQTQTHQIITCVLPSGPRFGRHVSFM